MSKLNLVIFYFNEFISTEYYCVILYNTLDSLAGGMVKSV